MHSEIRRTNCWWREIRHSHMTFASFAVWVLAWKRCLFALQLILKAIKNCIRCGKFPISSLKITLLPFAKWICGVQSMVHPFSSWQDWYQSCLAQLHMVGTNANSQRTVNGHVGQAQPKDRSGWDLYSGLDRVSLLQHSWNPVSWRYTWHSTYHQITVVRIDWPEAMQSKYTEGKLAKDSHNSWHLR